MIGMVSAIRCQASWGIFGKIHDRAASQEKGLPNFTSERSRPENSAKRKRRDRDSLTTYMSLIAVCSNVLS